MLYKKSEKMTSNSKKKKRKKRQKHRAQKNKKKLVSFNRIDRKYILFFIGIHSMQGGTRKKEKKETVDTDILVTSRNGDKKIMQSIKIRS